MVICGSVSVVLDTTKLPDPIAIISLELGITVTFQFGPASVLTTCKWYYLMLTRTRRFFFLLYLNVKLNLGDYFYVFKFS